MDLDPLAILDVISRALAMPASALFSRFGDQGGRDQIRSTLGHLERERLIAARQVGDESVYSITARGVAAIENAQKRQFMY